MLNKKLYIRYGGPVESGRGFVLHSDEVIQKETLSIAKGVALTSTSEFFEDLSKGKGPKNSILALGYAGWGPGQIELELSSNSWMTLDTDSDFIFDESVSNKWKDAFNMLGYSNRKLGNNEEAFKYYNKALEYYQKAADKGTFRLAYFKLGLSLIHI